MDTAASDSSPKKRRRIFMKVMVSLLLVGLAGASGFFYVKYQEVLNAPTPAQKLVDRLSPVLELPQEAPTLLTIADKSKLTNETLASQVQDGDQLLVFNDAKKIVVYRPSLQKATNMLSIQESVAADTAAVTPQAKP